MPCLRCGNLEEGQAGLGHDLAWNAYLASNELQLEMLAQGYTRLHLTNPPYSSAGNLFYTVTLRDTTWRITNTAAYSEAYDRYVDYQASVGTSNLNASVQQGERLSIAAELSSSISRGTDPFESRLLNSKGNQIDVRDRQRSDPQQVLAIPNNSDEPDPRYQRSECIDEDPRATELSPEPSNSNGLDQPDLTGGVPSDDELMANSGSTEQWVQTCWQSQASQDGVPFGEVSTVCVIENY